MKQLAVPEPLSPQGHYTPSGTGDTLDIRSLMGILRRRKLVFAQAFIAVLLVGIAATMLSRTVYETNVKLLVPPVANTLTLTQANDPFAQLLASNQPDSTSAQAQVLQSSSLWEDAKEKAKVLPRRGVAAPSLKVKLMQEGSQINNIILITIKGGDPNEISRLANSLVDLHIENTRKNQTEGLEQTAKDVREERNLTERQVQDATRDLVSFQRTHNVERLRAVQQAQGEQLVLLQTQRDQAAGNIASLERQLSLLNGRMHSEPRDFAQVRTLDNPLRGDIEQSIRKLKVQRTSLLENFQPDSEDVKAVEGEIRRFQSQLVSTPAFIQQKSYAPNPRWDTLAKQISDAEGALLKARQDYAQAATALVEQERQSSLGEPWEVRLTTLTEARDQAVSRYKDLASKLMDLEFRLKANPQPLRVLERAEVPTVPVQPNRPMLLVLSTVFAVVLATGIVFLVEYMDDRLNESEDIQRLYALPTLAHVPQSDDGQVPVLAMLPAQSHLAEAYRALRSSIEFAGIDSAIQCLQITSASKGEGKSTTALNLATTIALAGKRVILVDADLRRPAVHRMLEVPLTPGLTDVLIGTASLDEVIRDTDTPGLRVICAGAVPPNPAELLASNAFAHVLEQLEARADLVMVDTPPCAPVTDPVIVAARMDAVLLVVNAGQTRKPVLSHALEMLGRARARVIGVVLNRVDGSEKGYYYYQYGGYYTDTPETRKRRRRSNGHEPQLPLGVGSPVRAGRATLDDSDAN